MLLLLIRTFSILLVIEVDMSLFVEGLIGMDDEDVVDERPSSLSSLDKAVRQEACIASLIGKLFITFVRMATPSFFLINTWK